MSYSGHSIVDKPVRSLRLDRIAPSEAADIEPVHILVHNSRLDHFDWTVKVTDKVL